MRIGEGESRSLQIVEGKERRDERYVVVRERRDIVLYYLWYDYYIIGFPCTCPRDGGKRATCDDHDHGRRDSGLVCLVWFVLYGYGF